MSSGSPSLDDLRREIDRIDDAMHDLLVQRTTVVEQVAQTKKAAGNNSNNNGNGDAFFRPGREALILRRLVARHSGPFPKRSVVRIWREIITGQLRVQTPIPVAAHAPGGHGGCWDLARDQFGVAATMLPMKSPVQVARAVRDGSAAIGVVPVPQEGEEEPWWPLLATSEREIPHIVARLPFAPSISSTEPSALVIARLFPEDTGEDCSYIVVHSKGNVSMSTLARDLGAAGFKPRHVASVAAADPPGSALHLVETPGLVADNDPRLGELLAGSAQSVTRVLPLGGYAVPLDPADLDRET